MNAYRTAHAYLRVSTDRQTVEHQRSQVQRLLDHACAPSGEFGELPAIRYVDEVESGAKARPKLAKLCNELRAGDVLAVWALDRLGRNALEMVNRIRGLLDRGVRVVSVQEPWIDAQGPVRDLLLFVFAWVAEQERRRLVERTKAGLATARANGKTLGRPAEVDPEELETAVRACLASRRHGIQGDSVSLVARRYGVPRSSLRRALAKTVRNSPQGKGAQKRPLAKKTDSASRRGRS